MVRLSSLAALTTGVVFALATQVCAATVTPIQCEFLWEKADTTGLGWLTQSQAAPYMSDFKAASTSGGGTLSRDEFMAACSKGLIRDSAVSASGSTQQ
jgi:hypothetical protein